METIQQHPDGYTPESAHDAYLAFKEEWTQYYAVGPLDKPPHKTKTLERALEGLAKYAGTYKNEDLYENLLHTEICGTAPIRKDRVIHFKLDTIRKHPSHHVEAGKIFSLEHKTTGKTWLGSWEDTWGYLFQVSCYNYALFCMVDDYEEVDGVIVNGAIFWPKQTKFTRIPVRKSLPLLEDWLHEANYWIDEIERNMNMLADSSPSERTMMAFPKASNACQQTFGGCPYPSRCALHANPLQHCDRIPMDTHVEYWDPRKREETAKKVVHLEPKTEALV